MYSLIIVPAPRPHILLCKIQHNSDVKRGQNLEAEAEARATRPRPRPISGGWGQGRDQNTTKYTI